MGACVAAVDVGTGSARAGIFDATGRMLARDERPIEVRRPDVDRAEQDSEQIWDAVTEAVGSARRGAGLAPAQIAGIAFDATCSLVVRSASGAPLGVSEGADPRWDTLLWQDHRARGEAAMASATGHAVVARDGGAVSPEMQIPKLMWLKRHRPEVWAQAGLVMDLTDFLAWKACGTQARSVCTLACKWTYHADLPDPWQTGFLREVGLEDLHARCGLPARATPVAQDLGRLLPAAAERLDLDPACRVSAGLIDAHAGALGSLAAYLDEPAGPAGRLALVAGTSNCVMALGRDFTPKPGLWGPYRDAILPGLWVQEGGQSASGGLLDHLGRWWGDAPPGRVLDRIAALRAQDGWDLAADLHVLPDFAGNRSPLADARPAGVISGLALDPGFEGLCRLYWRTAVGIALGLRQIITHLTGDAAARPDLHLSGGHSRSALLTGLYASATGCRVIAAPDTDAVLLGTAMAAAAGAGVHPDLATAAAAMHQPGCPHLPDPAARSRLDRDYAVFLAMQRHRAEIAGLV